MFKALRDQAERDLEDLRTYGDGGLQQAEQRIQPTQLPNPYYDRVSTTTTSITFTPAS